MSSYISYRVKIKDSPEEVRVDADDVNVDCPCGEFANEQLENMTCTHEKAWFNFTKGDQTVAAIPFNQVLYIID